MNAFGFKLRSYQPYGEPSNMAMTAEQILSGMVKATPYNNHALQDLKGLHRKLPQQ